MKGEINHYYWASLTPLKDFSMNQIKHFSYILHEFNNDNRHMMGSANLYLRNSWKNGIIEHEFRNGKTDFSRILEIEVDLYRATVRGRRLITSDYKQFPRLLLSVALERFEKLVAFHPKFKDFRVQLNHKRLKY